MSAATVTADDLRRVRTRIEDPQRWTQDVFARNAAGHPCSPVEWDAQCWCIEGAAIVEGVPREPLQHLARQLTGVGTVDINDSHGHTATVRFLDRAIAVLEREAGS